MSVSNRQNAPSFRIERVDSFLNGLVCKERVDRKLVYKFIHSSYSLTPYSTHNKFAKGLFVNKFTQASKYLQRLDEGQGTALITYRRKEDGIGRSDPEYGIGLFLTPRDQRAMYCREKQLDIDAVNCQPGIIENLCEAEHIACHILKDYSANREQHLADVMDAYQCSRDAAKNAFIVISFGAGFNRWVEDQKIDIDRCRPEVVVDGGIVPTAFIARFKGEMTAIANHACARNPHLVEIVKTRKLKKGQTEYNLASSVLSLVAQEWERRMLEVVVKHCMDTGVIVDNEAALCADGLVVLAKRVPDHRTFTTAVEGVVRDALGINMVFTVKGFDSDLTEAMLDKASMYNMLTDHCIEDRSIARYVATKYNDRFLKKPGDACYVYTGVYWQKLEKDDSAIINFLGDVVSPGFSMSYDYLVRRQNVIKNVECARAKEEHEAAQRKAVANLDYTAGEAVHPAKKTKVEDPLEERLTRINKKHALMLKLISDTHTLIKKKTLDEKKTRSVANVLAGMCEERDVEFDQNPFLFVFTNKVYDLNLGEFVHPDPSQYMSQTCGWAYDDKYDTKGKVAELEAILAQIFPDEEVRMFALIVYATGLPGVQIESFVSFLGKGRNGKGLLGAIMLAMFGKYGYALSASLVQKPFEDGPNPQVADMHNKRFILMTEPDADRSINAATVKKLTGDQVLNARGLYDKNTQKTMRAIICCESNSPLAIKDQCHGMVTRYLAILFETIFHSQEDYNNASEDARANMILINAEYKLDRWRKGIVQAMFEILRGKPYKAFMDAGMKLPPAPKRCEALAREHMLRGDVLSSFILDNFEEDKTAVMPISALIELFTSSSAYMSMTKSAQSAINTPSLFVSALGERAMLAPYLVLKNRRYGEKGDDGERPKARTDILTGWRHVGENGKSKQVAPPKRKEEGVCSVCKGGCRSDFDTCLKCKTGGPSSSATGDGMKPCGVCGNPCKEMYATCWKCRDTSSPNGHVHPHAPIFDNAHSATQPAVGSASSSSFTCPGPRL
jgi:phage/plasmid-associated DNA primase